MAEAFPPGATYEPKIGSGTVPNVEGVDRSQLVNYSERKEYLGRRSTAVALEVFGDDFSRPGMFFSEAGSDHDIPYMVVCEGDGHITSYNLFHNSKSAARGLGGIVITEELAEYLRTA